MTERDFFTIGEVVRELEGEFDDLSISKVRYLEDQGIVTPERTAGGYRKFSDREVRRLRLALRLQRDHFLPLHVIRERLREAERGNPAPDVQSEMPTAANAEVVFDSEGRVPVDEVTKSLGITPELIKSLEGFGLVRVFADAEGRMLERSDVEVLKAAHEMTRYGLEARHLRMYLAFAERQATLFAQIMLPSSRQRSPEARQRLVAALKDLASGSDVLTRELLARALAAEFPDFGD